MRSETLLRVDGADLELVRELEERVKVVWRFCVFGEVAAYDFVLNFAFAFAFAFVA